MNKGFFKFLINLLIFIIVIWGIFAIVVKKFPMYIFDDEFATYKQTMDYIDNTDEYNKVLIFGDSVAKAAVEPEAISDSMYNLAMAGGTPIEQYFIMQEYLEKHEAPKTVVMIYFLGGFTSVDNFFWNRTVYFNCLTNKQFNEIMDTGLFPNTNLAKFKYLQYKLAMPHKYYAAAKNALFQNRYEANKQVYEDTERRRGQHYFGLELAYAPNNTSINDQESFEPLEVIDYYLNQCIEMCLEKDIQVIIEQHPINVSTMANIKEGFKTDYKDYMDRLKKKYPAIIVNSEFEVKPDDWFGDFSHLNPNGAKHFTYELNDKYHQYFD